MFEIELLKEKDEHQYSDMLKNSSVSMLYHSIPFRNLMIEFLECEPLFLIAKKDGEVVGGLPSFLKKNSNYGNILNSLPFFGSNGGFVVDSNLNNEEIEEIKKSLLIEFNKLAEDNNCVLSTIITSPFDNDIEFYNQNISYKFKDGRIGQIAVFENPTYDLENYIMYNIIEKRCRAAIRRPIKQGITVQESNDFQPLFEMHTENISSKSGIVKPFNFFESAQKNLKKNYSLTYAVKEDKIIAGLLLLYFKDTVEYFTPAFYLDQAIEQGTSLLMYDGMKKAIDNGYRYWNFGGTWETQTGVYKFKKSWGAQDFQYNYYIQMYENIDQILELTPEVLVNEYKWFYVVPFSELKSNK
jgi:hypothetical protein